MGLVWEDFLENVNLNSVYLGSLLVLSFPSGASERYHSVHVEAHILPWMAYEETGWHVTAGIFVGRLQERRYDPPHTHTHQIFPRALHWGQRGEEGGTEQSLGSSCGVGESGKIVSYSFLFVLWTWTHSGLSSAVRWVFCRCLLGSPKSWILKYLRLVQGPRTLDPLLLYQPQRERISGNAALCAELYRSFVEQIMQLMAKVSRTPELTNPAL